MTDCNTARMLFSNLGRRAIQANFDGGWLTSDAGALLLRQVDRGIGLIDSINRVIPDPRDFRFIQHEQRSMLAQRIFSLALGYEDLNDQQTLRHDPLLQTTTDRLPDPDVPLASPPTLCRLENRVGRDTLIKIAARVKVSARQIVFHLASGCPYQILFRHVTQRLNVLIDTG